MAAKTERSRNRGEIFNACVRRAISGDFSTAERFKLLKKLAALDPRGTGARGMLEELRWTPTLESLAAATEWMQKRDKRTFGNISEYAARSAIAIAPGMNAKDPKQRKAAIAAVKEAMTITTDEKTITAAKAFIAEHGK